MHKPLSKKEIKDLNEKFASQVSNKEIVLVLQDVIDPINVGSLFRIADGLGARLILTGQTPIPPHKNISMTSRGLERSVDWSYIETFEAAASSLKNDGFKIIGLELAETSKLYSTYKYPNKVALVLGSEAHGIYKKNLDLCDHIVCIPMLGKGPSLNVNVAAAIVGYQIISL